MLDDITQALLNVIERKINRPRPGDILDTIYYQDIENNPITIISIEEKDTTSYMGMPLIALPHGEDTRIATWSNEFYTSKPSITTYGTLQNEITKLLNDNHTVDEIVENPKLIPLIDTNTYTKDKYIYPQETEIFDTFAGEINWEKFVNPLLQAHSQNQ